MKPITWKKTGAVAVLCGVWMSLSVLVSWAQASESQSLEAQGSPVIELFTSQGCYSCPPADELLAELIERDDSLIALEYHVDYWDTLVYGSAGQWVDPFSQAAFSARQRGYNQKPLKGRTGVYTPQVIVNGQYAAVGSVRKNVEAALAQPRSDRLDVSIDRSDSGWQVKVLHTSDLSEVRDAKVWWVRYQHQATTEITAGENKGLSLTNHNIVLSVEDLGSVSDGGGRGSSQFSVQADSDENIGCAVLIQDNFQSPILAAAKCPA